jgi:hypothetical protein
MSAKDDQVVMHTLLLCELDDGPKFAGHGDSASPDGHAAGPDRDTVGTTCDTTDNSANVSAKPPEWIVTGRDYSGRHAGFEFSGTSHAWHQHVAFDGEPGIRRTVLELHPSGSPCGTLPGKFAGNGGFDESSDFKPRL